MRKICLFLGMLLLLWQPQPVRADEGMWLLPLLKKLNGKDMKEAGLKLSVEDIYSINRSSLKDAVVIFGGGCTGEVVSPEGLLLTNHHCGYGAIQNLSSVEHNYLKDGYWAMNRSEELPAPGLSVTFLERIEDLSKDFNKVLNKCATETERKKALASLIKEAEDKVKEQNPKLRGMVSSLYGGNMYYLFIYKIYTDIRFVGAPPSSIGKFGADTDNWIWPRHTCDFSVFRIYAGPDNEPADYAPENRPLQAKKSLAVSIAGVKEGDFVMTLGFPGTTTRFMTAAEVAEQQDVINRTGIEARTLAQNILLEDMLADPKVQLQYASKYSGLTNAWKKWIGMNETFAKLHVQERRAQEEQAFMQWIGDNAKRRAKYGTALSDITEAVDGRRENLKVLRYLSESLRNIELSSLSYIIENAVKSDRTGDKPAWEKRLQNFYKNYNLPTDVKLAKAMIKFFAEKVDKAYYPDFYQTIAQDFGGDTDAYVDTLYKRSPLVSCEKAVAFLQQDKETILNILQNDPAAQLGRQVNESIGKQRREGALFSDQYNRGHRNYIAGILAMNPGKATYPDATFTMRLTYGKVLSYKPKDAVVYDYYTTLTGVMEKEDPDNWEFIVPERLKELYQKKDYYPYAEPGEELHTGFIANTDITGGNSGSPVLNARGELIGLAFDGNWESMSGDVIFEPELQRCIAVDIRYVLFIMDKFGGAGYLLDEMTVNK